MREGYGSWFVCLSVITLAATYRYHVMAFQMHDSCGFLRKRFVRQFWRHLPILSFLTLPEIAIA